MQSRSNGLWKTLCRQEDGDVSHEESDEEDGDGDEDVEKDDGDEEEEEMVGMDEEDPSTKDEPKLKENKKKEKKQQSSIPRDKRTIFVGNISKETQKKVNISELNEEV